MRLREIASEAWRNVGSRLGGFTVVVALTWLMMVSLAALDVTQIGALLRQAYAYRDSGAATYVVSAEGAVDGTRCEALNRVSGVLAAGALRAAHKRFAPLTTPLNAIPVYEITSGLARQLNSAYSVGTALDSATAESLGITPGQVLVGSLGDAAVVATFIFPSDGRDQTLSYALTMSGSPSGLYDECWVSMWPPSASRGYDLADATLVYATDKGSIQVGQLNGSLGSERNSARDFNSRTGRFAPLAGAVLGLFVGFGLLWLRRLELSMLLHVGLTRLDLLVLVTLETGMILAAAVPPAVVSCALFTHFTASGVPWPFGTRVVSFVAVGLIAGVIAATLRVREDRVYAYFKNR